MGGRPHRSPFAPAWLAGMALATPALAEEAVRFDYRAPTECPNLAVFEQRVRDRSLHIRVAVQGELARTFDVVVTTGSDSASASVEFVDGDGSSLSRTVRGATCDEVVSSIALVIALAIDARATQRSVPSPSPRPPSARQEIPRSRLHAPPTPTAGTWSTARMPEAARRQRSLVPARHAWGPTVGLGAGFASHGGPSGALTFDASLAVRPFSARSSVRGSLFHFRSEGTTSTGQRATFRGYGFRADACPWALVVRSFFAEPCVGLDLGVIAAKGVDGALVVNPRSSARFWGQAEAISRLGVVLGALVLEAQGELSVPFSSYRFGFGAEAGGVDAFEVPPVGVAARAGAGFRFR